MSAMANFETQLRDGGFPVSWDGHVFPGDSQISLKLKMLNPSCCVHSLNEHGKDLQVLCGRVGTNAAACEMHLLALRTRRHKSAVVRK